MSGGAVDYYRPVTLRPEIAPADDFVHLHVHSEFSLLDGLSRTGEMTRRAADLGMKALAVTDHGAMYGTIEFYSAAKAAGIKPIIGIEQYIAPRGMTLKEGKADADYYHMVLLAKNDVGYRNLLALTTAAHLDGYYYKPRIDKELLAKHAEGLIGTSACLGGEVLRRLAEGDERAARQAADDYRSILGPENFYIEVQDHGVPQQNSLHPQLVELARDMKIPLLATNDTHYTVPEQHDAHDLLLCIGTATNVDTPGRLKFETNEFFLKSPAEMRRLFRGELGEAMDNTVRVAEQVDLKLEFDQLRLPHFPVPDGETAESWLRKECERGLVDRYGPRLTDEVRHRLDYELGIIDRMGYSGYFLIVADFTRFAREQGIYTTCRGSAPGSIVTYSLHITPVDPLAYGLPFERFLNPDRVTMPDIDIDFQDSPPGRGDRVRHPQVRRRPGGADHHLRDAGRQGRHPRRGAGDGPDLRRGGSGGQGGAQRAEHQPGPRGRDLTPAARADRRRRAGGQADRHRQAAGGRGPPRLHPCRRDRDQPRAADRDHAAAACDRRPHHHDPVRDARLRGAGPAEVRLPGPDQPHHPGRCGGADPRAPRRGDRRRQPAARRQADLRAAVHRRDDRHLPARGLGDAPLRQGPEAHRGPGPGGHGRALPAGTDGQHPCLHPPEARRGAGHLPARVAGAGAARHLRDLRLPGRHHDRRHRHGRLHRPRGGQPLLRDPQEEGIGPSRARGQVQGRRQEEGHPARRWWTRCSPPSSRLPATGSTRPTPPATG